MDIIQNLWMLLILPLLATFFTCIPNAYVSLPKRRITLFLAIFSSGLSMLLTLFCLKYLQNNPGDFFESNITFLNAGIFKIHLGVLLDNVSAYMLGVLYPISLAVIVFSYKYMKNEEGFSRYFAYLNMLVFSMTGLILSTNLIQSCIFLELIGLFSYLSIGFYYKKPETQRAARKTFLIFKIGDFAIFASILGFAYFLLQDIENLLYPILSLNDVSSWGLMAYVQLGPGLYAALCLLAALAALVKSAQVPFQMWISDASDAPAPLSALINGAITITAGIYLLIRIYPAMILSPIALKTIAAVGIITAIMCAAIALVQSDIKKILSFSTASQAGIMLAALGCGAYSGTVLHLGMHGIAKAMMFLIAGIIIHKTFTRNIKFLGGLREYTPILAAGWLLGCISITGIFFSGFYSKEMILSHIYGSGQFVYLSLIIIAILLTVLYLFRSYFLIFEGQYKGSYDFSIDEDKPYDGINLFMLIPSAFLAFLCAFLGGFVAPNFQRYVFIIKQKFYLTRHPELEISMFIICGIIIYFMWQIYTLKKFKIKRIRLIYKFIVLQFYIVKFFEYVYKILIKGIAKIIKVLDKYVISGFYLLIGQVARFGGYLTLRLQNGSINSYIFCFFAFILAILICTTMVYLKGLMQYGG